MLHQYQLNGYNIVLDTCSGSVHVVDGAAYDLIALYSSHSEAQIIRELLQKYRGREDITEEELRACYSQVTSLRAAGKLFTPDHFQPLAEAGRSPAPAIKALCLHVAHTCNLNCAYCFAGQGRYQGERSLMSVATGRRALDFLLENSGARRNLEVDFFGGEPLMNFQVVKELVAYARSREQGSGKRFRFTLTTNGLLIDDQVIDFANREMSNVVMSLDGRQEVHDRLRRDYAGQGSWARIVPKFQQLAQARGERDYYIRGTFTHANPDFSEDIFLMADLGFTKLSMEPVVCAPADPAALTEEDLPILLQQYEILAREMLRRRRAGQGFDFYHYMIDLAQGPCIYKRLSGCGVGKEYLAVTPGGELYPCHQLVGEEKFKLGDIWQGIVNTPLQEEFGRCHAYARPDCADCWARLYCSGGCAANAYHATGSILGIYEYGCRLFRKRLECAIMLQVAAALDNNGAAD